MLPNYYINDYFNILRISREKEYMKTDIRESTSKYIIEIDAPGIKKENIIINYDRGYLTIKIIKLTDIKPETYIRKERLDGEIKRSFYIGDKKESDIKASYTNGLLTITFPKEDIITKQIPNIIIK